MVTPRFEFVQAFDRALVRQQARVGGLVQRGVVVDVNDLYSPALCTVQVELRNGQTARVPNVQVLSTSYDPANPPAAPRAGQRVLLLCPTGRALDLCFVMGLATTGKFLFENLRNPNVGTLQLTTRRNFTTTLLLTPPNGATAIEIRGVQVAVVGGRQR